MTLPGFSHIPDPAPAKTAVGYLSWLASTNPGYCFLRAGWRRAGLTKGGHGRPRLVILERC